VAPTVVVDDMARYVAVVDCPLSAPEAFALVADLRRFADWDPGVATAVQTSPAAADQQGPGADAVYELTLAPPSAPVRLRYRVVEFQPPNRVVVEARTRLLRSFDTISVAETATGSLVVYEAELHLAFPFGLADPIVGQVFRVIGDRAAEGLRRFLEGAGDSIDRADPGQVGAVATRAG
jgi:hypothetical protein